MPDSFEPLFILGYEVKTLSTYITPYYYLDSNSRHLGAFHHFQTIRQLKNYANRLVKAGKLSAR